MKANIKYCKIIKMTYFFVLFILCSSHVMSQSRDKITIQWKGKSVEAIKDEVVIIVKPGYTVDNAAISTLQTGAYTIMNYPDDMRLMKIKLPASKSITNALEEISLFEFVEGVSPILIGEMYVSPNDSLYGRWQADIFSLIGAPSAWNITTGNSDIIVGILDSGIPMVNGVLSHWDLRNSSRVILGKAFVDAVGLKDENGHGTHVAGILSAETNNRDGVAGTSWKTKLYIDKIVRKVDGAIFSDIFYAAVKHMIDTGCVKIINFSGGWPSSDSYISSAIVYAYNHNVLFVASSGNYNTAVAAPASLSEDYSNVIAVGATNDDDTRWYNSNYGPELNIVAPGVNILSTLPNYNYDNSYGLNYGRISGTSMAAPFVAGVAALMLSVNPNLTPSQLRSMLQESATQVSGMNGDTFHIEYGYGRLHAYKALLEVAPEITYPVGNCNTFTTIDEVTISWKANASGRTFEIRLSTDNGVTFPTTIASSVTSGTTSYSYVWSVPSVTSGDCKLQIKDVSISGYANKSVVFGVNTPHNPPSTPANFTLTQKQSHPWLQWTANPNVSGYKLYRYIVGYLENDWALFNTITDPSINSYVDEFNTILPNGQGALCYYKMTSFTECAESPYTSALSVYVDPTYIEKTLGLSITTVPTSFELGQNYPNPFNPTTKIEYAIPKKARVTIKIYNTLGAEVSTLVNEDKPLGFYEVVFDGSKYASGIYFYRMTAGEFTETKKLILVK